MVGGVDKHGLQCGIGGFVAHRMGQGEHSIEMAQKLCGSYIALLAAKAFGLLGAESNGDAALKDIDAGAEQAAGAGT